MAEWAKAWIAQTLGVLEAAYGVPPTEPLSDPLDELIACILSQHTTDAASLPAFERLKVRFPTWEALASADLSTLASTIREAGLANQKAKAIQAALERVRRDRGEFSLEYLRDLPTDVAQQDLMSLPGVGPKTAAIVLCFALGRDVLPVDTHVYRVAVRLGWVPEVGEGRAHAFLARVVPDGLARRLHLALIQHGRSCCTARNPRCSSCPIRARCPAADESSVQLRESLLRAQPSLEAGLRLVPKRGPRRRLRLLTLWQWALKKARTKAQIGYSEEQLASAWPRTLRRKSTLSVPAIEAANLRHRVAEALGPSARLVWEWIEAQPDPERLYACLLESEEALHRVATVAESAPALVRSVSHDQAFTLSLFEVGVPEFLVSLDFAPDEPPAAMAATLSRAANRLAISWVLDPVQDLGAGLADLYDRFIRYVCGRLCLNVDVLAMGSYGTREMELGSDLDLAILARSDGDDAQAAAVTFIAFCAALAKHGAPLQLDFGIESVLRGPGLAPVRSYDGLQQYELEAMTMAERFGLGHARVVWGDPVAANLLQRAAYAVPLTPERLRELVACKRRHESQNVLPKHRRRDVKRGIGGLGDIEWFVHLHELRYPTATQAGTTTDMAQRVRNIASARLINAAECEEILEARRHLQEVRHRLILLGLTRDVVPENPDKLARLAHEFGYADANDFLSIHERVVSRVRSIYEEGLERLKA